MKTFACVSKPYRRRRRVSLLNPFSSATAQSDRNEVKRKMTPRVKLLSNMIMTRETAGPRQSSIAPGNELQSDVRISAAERRFQAFFGQPAIQNPHLVEPIRPLVVGEHLRVRQRAHRARN